MIFASTIEMPSTRRRAQAPKKCWRQIIGGTVSFHSDYKTGIAEAIKNICAKPRLKALHYEKEEEVKVYLFTQGMQIPPEIVRMMQKFDYSQEIPKIILFNNGISGILSRSDAAMSLLLNQFGLDIYHL